MASGECCGFLLTSSREEKGKPLQDWEHLQGRDTAPHSYADCLLGHRPADAPLCLQGTGCDIAIKGRKKEGQQRSTFFSFLGKIRFLEAQVIGSGKLHVCMGVCREGGGWGSSTPPQSSLMYPKREAVFGCLPCRGRVWSDWVSWRSIGIRQSLSH